LGTYLAPCAYLAHRNEDVYPQPESFRPERFLGGRPPPWAFFPFGGSNRVCLGATFAHFEMVAILATILREANLRLAGPASVAPVRATITLIPGNGTPVVLERVH
jgi:cytochrome P450